MLITGQVGILQIGLKITKNDYPLSGELEIFDKFNKRVGGKEGRGGNIDVPC